MTPTQDDLIEANKRLNAQNEGLIRMVLEAAKKAEDPGTEYYCPALGRHLIKEALLWKS